MRITRFAPIVLVLLAGCSGGSKKVTNPPPPPSAPVNSTPQNAVLLFKWGWEHLSVALQDSVLTSDFQFFFVPGDTATTAFGSSTIDRATLLGVETHMFTGAGTTSPKATSITFKLDNTLHDAPNGRGLDPTTHREITSSLVLAASFASGPPYGLGGIDVTTTFWVVRGDAGNLTAAQPPRADRWYVEGVVDNTTPPPTIGRDAIRDVKPNSWSRLLALYK
jgi:hypothetical protein